MQVFKMQDRVAAFQTPVLQPHPFTVATPLELAMVEHRTHISSTNKNPWEIKHVEHPKLVTVPVDGNVEHRAQVDPL